MTWSRTGILSALALLAACDPPRSHERSTEQFSFPHSGSLWNQAMGDNNKINIYLCWKDRPTDFFKRTALAALADSWETVSQVKFNIADTCPAKEKEEEEGSGSDREPIASAAPIPGAGSDDGPGDDPPDDPPGDGSGDDPPDGGDDEPGDGSDSPGDGPAEDTVYGEGDDVRNSDMEASGLGGDDRHPIPITLISAGRDRGPWVSALGNGANQVNLDPAWNPPNSNNGGGGAIDCSGDGAEGARMVNCIKRQTIHEFGHVLGLAHEHNRADRPVRDTCPARRQGSDGTFTQLPYDRGSIMSYCADYRTPTLTTNDTLAIKQLYGSNDYRTTKKDFVIVGGTPNIAYFFNGTKYTRYRMDRKEPVATESDTEYWPIDIRGTNAINFRDLPDGWTDVDAAVSWGDPLDRIYLFRGTENVRVDPSNRRKVGGPWTNKDNWEGLPEAWTGVDAAVYIGTTTDANDYKGVYLFRGSQYVRYDIATLRVPEGYPHSIADDWDGLSDAGFERDIDYVFMVKEDGKRKLVFVKKDQQLTYDLDDGGGVDHPNEGVVARSKKPVYGSGNYPGLAFGR
jgi:hypothetical protein